VKQLPVATVPREMPSVIQSLDNEADSFTGVLPNIYGAGPREQTAKEATNNLNQALMQLGMTGEGISSGWRQIAYLAVMQYAKNASSLRVPGGGEVPNEMQGEEVDLEALLNGKFYAESEPGIPTSIGEQKDALQLIIGQNPALASSMGISSPSNAGFVSDTLSLPPGLKIPGEDQRQKTLEVISQLQQGQPIMGQDPMTGAPKSEPSIQFEDIVDDPQLVLQIVREWLISPAGRKIQGTPGYENVKAYLMQVFERTMPPPPPPGMGQKGDGGKPPSPPDLPTGEAPPPDADGSRLPPGTEGSLSLIHISEPTRPCH
jgi:hypothetical protein